MPNTLIIGLGNMDLQAPCIWVPLSSHFRVVSKSPLDGQGAGGGTPSIIVDGCVKDDPNDHEQGKRCHKAFFCELPRAAIFFLIYL